MAGTCCGRRAARATMENINQSLGDLGERIRAPGSGAAGLARDPNCACDPCMCPSDDVPCNARYLGNDLTDRGLQQALDRLVRHARQIEAAQGDACDCADQPPLEPEPEPESEIIEVPRETGVLPFPPEIRNRIYEFYFEDLNEILPDISAVRFRLSADDDYNLRSRLFQRFPTGRPSRHILDHLCDPPPYADENWTHDIENWRREVAAITYEPTAMDEDLATLPGERLGLLRVSRETYREAGGLFYQQEFRFHRARDVNCVAPDHGVYHAIMAADAFFADRSAENMNMFSNITLNLDSVYLPQQDNSTDPFTRGRARVDRRLNASDGRDRLGSLAGRLRQMPFERLQLYSSERPLNWYDRRITVSGPILSFQAPISK